MGLPPSKMLSLYSLRGHLVLALSLLEVNDRDVPLLDESLDLLHKCLAHDTHEGRRSDRLPIHRLTTVMVKFPEAFC
jgi:hypothetical protein